MSMKNIDYYLFNHIIQNEGSFEWIWNTVNFFPKKEINEMIRNEFSQLTLCENMGVSSNISEAVSIQIMCDIYGA